MHALASGKCKGSPGDGENKQGGGTVRKVLLMMGLSMLGVLMFVPMAWAQDGRSDNWTPPRVSIRRPDARTCGFPWQAASACRYPTREPWAAPPPRRPRPPRARRLLPVPVPPRQLLLRPAPARRPRPARRHRRFPRPAGFRRAWPPVHWRCWLVADCSLVASCVVLDSRFVWTKRGLHPSSFELGWHGSYSEGMMACGSQTC